MQRVSLSFVFVMAWTLPVSAQDTPLSKIIVEKDGWREMSASKLGSPLVVQSRAGISYRIEKDRVLAFAGIPGKEKALDLPGLVAPSSLTLWPDEGHLVIGTAEGAWMWAVRIEKDGNFGPGDRYYSLRTTPGEKTAVAAMTMDAGYLLYACTPLGIQVFDPSGRLSGVLPAPSRAPLTAIAIGGPGGDMLFVACGDKVFGRRIQGKAASTTQATSNRQVAQQERPVRSGEVPGLTKEEIKEGFKSIFDGKTLAGWKGATAGYTAEEGLLVCQKKGGGNIFTDKEYGDFVFRFDFKFEPGGNNGVSVRGHEIQILDDYAPQHKNIKPCQYHGSIYCKVPAKRGHTKPAGEWNSQEIMVQGSHWKVTVNGVVIVDADISKVEGLEALAKRARGPLGFLGHGTRVEFRNLRVREMESGDGKEK